MGFDMRHTFPSRVSVIGAARSGLAAATFFARHGIAVFISDTGDSSKLSGQLQAAGLGSIAFEGGAHSDKVLDAELIVLSPGVPSDIPVLLAARERKIPVWSEIELGYRSTEAAFLAVTGSTGKSTTVSLLGEALKAGGRQTVVAGNIGLPLISVAPQLSREAWVALEVSSFQLETIDTFKPCAAAVLNFMKNHLDRYRSEQDYYDAKKLIARNMDKENYLVLNWHDAKLREWAAQIENRTNIVYFGSKLNGVDCFWVEHDRIRYQFRGNSGEILDVNDMRIGGGHNHENACVAAALAKVAGVGDTDIARGICSFAGLAHRLEYVAEVKNIRFYNDSKSTTAESILCALEAFPGKIHLIAGGKDKGCDFSVVNESITRQVKDIILIGQAAARMEAQWSGLRPIYRAGSLGEAIDMVSHYALPGDVVVFSPGCSSFDMFENFEQRGDVFRELVRKKATAKDAL